MPLDSRRDDQKRRLIVTLAGEVTLHELSEFVATQIGLGLWKFSVLHDATAAGVTLMPLEAVQMEMWHELQLQYGPRGRIAFLVTDQRQREIAQRYVDAATAEDLFSAGVFNDRTAAERWLDEKESAQGISAP